MTILLLQATASGIVTGCVYALIALTLSLVYKSTEVVNFAGGELVMIGAYMGMVGLVYFDLPYPLTIVLCAVVLFILGFLFDRVVLSRTIARVESQSVLVAVVTATLGFSYVLKGSVRVFSYTEEVRRLPPLFSGPPIFIGPIVLQRQDIAIVVSVIAVMALLWAFFRFTLAGKALRATSQNPKAAALIGIPVDGIRVLVWGGTATLAGLAGLLLGPKLLLTPEMGSILILALAAACVGGFTSMPGCVVGGVLLGILQNLAGLFISSRAIAVVPFLIIMAVLTLRPQGLLGGRVVARKV